MEADFGTGQTPHFEELQRHVLVIECPYLSDFAHFQIGNAALAHGGWVVCQFRLITN